VYAVTGSWQGGFQGEVTVTAGSSPIQGWTVSWTFPNGQVINQIWSGTHTQSGANVTVSNVAYNGALPAGGSTTFGFIATTNGTNNPPTNLTCTTT
jgi:alpha-L-fucosidase 2